MTPCGPYRKAGLKSSLLPRAPHQPSSIESTLPAPRQRRMGAPYRRVGDARGTDTMDLSGYGWGALLPHARQNAHLSATDAVRALRDKR